MKIISVRPEWSEEYDNPAGFEVLVSRKVRHQVYEERDGVYVTQDGPIIWHFSYDGKPNEGFGGWRRTVKMLDGSERAIVGGWYSGASLVNRYFPELLCVDCAYTNDRATWERGHTFQSGQVRAEALIEWYVANRRKVDWGLYLFNTKFGPMLCPSKGRFVKPSPEMSNWLARLFPETGPRRRAPPPSWAQPAHLTTHFVGKMREAWGIKAQATLATRNSP